MNKFQNVNFNNFDEFYDYIDKDEKEIVLYLRDLVYEIIPDAKEKLSFNVPFFHRNKAICYIWPSSIPWGKVKNKGVSFSLSKGYLLNDKHNYLDRANRKQIYSRIFYSIQDIDEQIVRELLSEALKVDNSYS